MARCYVRNGVWGWSLEEQRQALREARVHEPDREYCDELSDTRAKFPGRVRPEWLTQRAMMLKPSSRVRGEMVHVATLLAIAVSEADLVSVLVAASGRRDTIKALDSGQEFALSEGPVVFQRAVDDWQRAKRDAQTKPGRLEGMRVAAAKRRATTMRKLAPAKVPWRDTKPDRLSTEQIAEQVGLSVKTLYAELGRRPAIRKGRSR